MEASILALLIAGLLVVGIPIIAILTSHQRKMAELIHGQQRQMDEGQERARIDQLEMQVRTLSARLDEQTIKLDEQQARLDGAERSLQERLHDRA